MTTTKKTTKTETAPAFNLDAATFGDVEGGESMGGKGSDAPAWVPHFSEFSEKIKAERMAKLPAGSTARADLRGKLAVERAWGRALYFVDVPTPDCKIAVRLPEHAALYNTLNQVALGADVKIVYAGRATKAKRGQQAPHVYDVTTKGGLNAPREDALVIMRREDDESDAAT